MKTHTINIVITIKQSEECTLMKRGSITVIAHSGTMLTVTLETSVSSFMTMLHSVAFRVDATGRNVHFIMKKTDHLPVF